MTLAFGADAEREVNEAYDYHERERPGHGELLVGELEPACVDCDRRPRGEG